MGIDAEIDTSQGGEIIQTLKDEIFCSICQAIFEDPLKLDCCDGHLCKVCYEDVKIKCQSCPLCRASNYSAKPSRLMVSVLSTITLNCPAEECNDKFIYSQFLKHRETCVYLNMKTCDRCHVKMDLPEYERHFACIETLLKGIDRLKKTNEEHKKYNEDQKRNFENVKKSNEAEMKKKYEVEMKKFAATKKTYAGLTVKHTSTLAENRAYASKIKELNIALENSKIMIKQFKLSDDGGSAYVKKLEEASQKQTNRIKNTEAEIKNLRQSLQQQKDNNAASKQKAGDAMSKTQTTHDLNIKALKSEMTELRSNYDHLCDLFCQVEDTDHCKSCKAGAINSLLPKRLQEDKEKVLNDKIKSLNITVEHQREQHKNAKKEVERRVHQSYESRIADLEARLQKKDEPSNDQFEKIKSKNSVMEAEILKLQKEISSFEQGKSELFAKFDYSICNVSSVSSSSGN